VEANYLFSGMRRLETKWAVQRWIRGCHGVGARAADRLIDLLPPKRGCKQQVIVLGAGLAGLSAACRLTELGHEVTVLEGSERAGGRALTLREPFTRRLHADAGAFRFRDDHDLVKSYVKRFKLTVAPFYPAEGTFLAYIGGTLFSRKRWERIQSRPLSRGLTETEEWCFNQEHDFQTFKFTQGADALPNALAEWLGNRIRYNCVVGSIHHDAQAVRVGFVNAEGPGELSADQLVCALPFSSLRGISISPAVPPEKQRLIDSLRYETPCLVYLQVRTSFLKKLQLNGFAITDTVGEIWHLTFDQESPVGIMAAYMRSPLGDHFAAMEEPERIRTAIERMEAIFPGISCEVERASSKCWGHDPWTGGAQSRAYNLPLSDVRIMLRAEGRLHFAGEHTGLRRHGGMEGAIESGHRVAREIDRWPG
jgi:monoamine oxidase